MSATHDPAGPRRRVPGALLVEFRRDPLGFLQRVAAEYGDLALFRIGPQRVYLVSHPDLVREVLVTRNRAFEKGVGLRRAERLLGKGLLTSEGEFHRRQRRLSQPAFHHSRIEAYGAAMAERAAQTGGRWRAGQPFDIHAEMSRLTLGIVAQTLFDADVEGDAAAVGEAIAVSLELFQRLSTVPFAEVLERLPLPGTLRFRRARRRLDAVIHRIIAERRAGGVDRGDLLSMLMLARDEEEPGGRMSDAQLRDEAMTLFLAGHETTAVALTWTWYLLARHPAAEARLHAEIDSVLGGRLPGAADLARLPYTSMVLAESLRLYPPAWVIGRRAVAEVEVGGYRLPRRALVLVSPWVTHRDPRFFPDPTRFEPERWTEAAKAARPRHAYFPFGAGERICIGEQFAWMEGVLVLAVLASRWRLRLVDGTEPAPAPSITLRPKAGARMVAERRTTHPAVMTA